jgi:uracil-DNA glycosylase family 4
MANCQPYLERELEFIHPKVIVALGRIAFEGILRILAIRDPSVTFTHNAAYQFPSASWLVCSYHPSRQNTQTGRLTLDMFDKVWKTVKRILEI